MKSRISLALVFAIVGLAGPRLPAQTNVGGLICTDTTWDVPGSPYIVINAILIGCDACLTIEPGVEVRFDLGLGIIVGSNAFGPGCLIARGTPGAEILFTSNAFPQEPGDWSRIFFTDFAVDAAFDMNDIYESGSILEHVIVEYAGGGFPAVTVDQSSPFIGHTEIRHNDHRGIDVNGTNAPPIRIEQCEIWENHASGNGGGISLTGGGGHRLTKNNIHDCSATSSGGGIYVNALTTLEGNNVHHCSASSGGGALFSSSSDNSMLTSNMFTNNNASSSGGGMYFSSSTSCTLTSNTITGNTASNDGGGMYFTSSGNCTLSSNTIMNNIASDDGGGILFNFSSGSILTLNTITGNTASTGGGGIWFGSSGSSTLTSNTITGNMASNNNGGGIIIFSSGNCTLSSNTITNNTCGDQGGAIYFSSSANCTMSDTEVTGNHTTFGPTGGIYVAHNSSGISFGGDPVAGVFNRIFGNDECDVTNANSFDASGINDINASDVWWGTCDINQIQNEICDFFDDPLRAFVLFFPIADPGGDSEFDGDVDLDDFGRFNPSDPTLPACFNGPCGPDCDPPLDPACGVFDFDCDGDVDERDFAEFANRFTGP